jgi:hypothetical protein
MTCRCGHSDTEHPTTHPCRGQIHYPSEDYPCTCDEFQPDGSSEVCFSCGHKRDLHGAMRRCTHEGCRCMKYQQAA